MSISKKALIVAYGFPPVGGAGVQRPVKFVKYLRDFGWEPMVLTVANPSVPVLDVSFEKDLPGDIKIFRAKTLEPSYTKKHAINSNLSKPGLFPWLKKWIVSFMLPDLQVLWWPSLSIELIKVIRSEQPRCIFVTAPPFSTFVPVVFLGRLLRTPVIVDFRDEWAFSRQQWEHSVKSGLATKVDAFFERYVVEKCTQFTAANASYINSIHRSYPQLPPDKGVVITNGFDDEDFAGLSTPVDSGDGRLVIAYSGTVWRANSLENFVSALRNLLKSDPSLRQKLAIHIYGRVVDEHKTYLEHEDLTDLVTLHGYIHHGKAVEKICQADVLLLNLSALPGSSSIIAGKLFEYMATGRHIFALIPEGETRSILERNYKKKTIVDPDDISEICRGLQQMLAGIDAIHRLENDDVSQFTRKKLTGNLAAVFDSVTP